MSSSVFSTCESLPRRDLEASNLVVVYGRNGIQFEESGLKNVIEHKSASAISIIRLTSPTPSIIEEQETISRQSEMLSDSDKQPGSELDGDSRNDSEYNSDVTSQTEEDDFASFSDNSTEADDDEKKDLPRRKLGRKTEVVKKGKKTEKRKLRSEILTLEIENVFTDKIARSIVNNALKLAGIQVSAESTREIEELISKVKHDHLYTPFTSPEQKLDIFSKEAKINGGNFINLNFIPTSLANVEPVEYLLKSERIATSTMQSQDTCNNDVKRSLKKSGNHKYNPVSQFEKQRSNMNLKEIANLSYPCNRQNPTNIVKVNLPKVNLVKYRNKTYSPDLLANQSAVKNTGTLNPTAESVQNNRDEKGLMLTKTSLPEFSASQLNISKISTESTSSSMINTQTEVLRNKSRATKGVFTDLNSLLKTNNRNTAFTHCKTFDKSRLLPEPNNKSFVPLNSKTGIANQLPAQICEQSQQISFPPNTEYKQLEFIDLFVQDELDKVGTVKTHESIPQLAKLLEVSAETLQQQSNVTNISKRNNVQESQMIDGINLSSTLANECVQLNDDDILLTTGDDDLTADFLQHVVGLIEGDQNFKKEVEQQVLGVPLSTFASCQLVAESQIPLTSVKSLLGPPTSTNIESLSVMSTSASVSTSTSASNDLEGYSRQPIKVVRNNGRVITLPPIEVPTTRARVRAKSSRGSNTILNTSRNSKSEMEDTTTRISQYKVHANQAGASTVRKRSDEVKDKTKTSTEVEAEAGATHDDDDDPNKLWCICRQPHNNRFMICCDICCDWFHGSCVNVSKLLGREIEQNGTLWKCPLCKKKEEEKKQPRINDMLKGISGRNVSTEHTTSSDLKNSQKKEEKLTQPKLKDNHQRVEDSDGENSAKNKTSSSASKHMLTIEKKRRKQINSATKRNSSLGQIKDEKLNLCLACKKPAPRKFNYCNNECVRKYTLAQLSNPLEFSDLHNKSKISKLPVIDRKTKAPSVQSQKKSSQENSCYGVVQPDSKEASKIDKHHSITPNTSLSAKRDLIAETTLRSHSSKEDLPGFYGDRKSVSNSEVQHSHKSLFGEEKSWCSKASERKTGNEGKKLSKSSNAQSDSKHSTDHLSLNQVDVRSCAQRTLKNILLSRLEQSNYLSEFTTQDVEKFSEEVEHEMFEAFEKNTGRKYRAKYRSLKFNIGDRNNETLFTKICTKQITPKQLVKMSPEEIASESLIKWREKESSHNLDIIKKSELELLSCAKNYVLKTHKGEEIIEENLHNFNVDAELTATLLNESEGKTDESDSVRNIGTTEASVKQEESKSENYVNTTSYNFSKQSEHRHSRTNQENQLYSRGKTCRDHEYRSHNKHKHQRRRRSDNSPKFDEKRRKINANGDYTYKSEDEKIRDVDQNSRVKHVKPNNTVLNNGECEIIDTSPSVVDTIESQNQKVEHEYTLSELPKQSINFATWIDSQKSKTPIWRGEIHMHEVISPFRAVMHPITSSHSIGHLLSRKFHNVGRIKLNSVKDYIEQIKLSNTKEVVVVSLLPETEEAGAEYKNFYDYMLERNRYCVVHCDKMEGIRDFYIAPLQADKNLPDFLQDLNGVAKWQNNSEKPDLLFGIVVRVIARRQYEKDSLPVKKTKIHKSSKSPSNAKLDQFDIDAIIRAPALLTTQKNRTDYAHRSLANDFVSGAIGGNDKDDIERQRHFLNKEIAQQMSEIQILLKSKEQNKNAALSTPTNVLAGIEIPTDLPTILEQIRATDVSRHKTVKASSATSDSCSYNKSLNITNPEEEEYDPADPLPIT